MTGIGLWLLLRLKGAWAFLMALKASTRIILALVAVVAVLVWHIGNVTGQRDDAITGRAADRASYAQAQAKAEEMATAAKVAEETRTATIKENSNHALDVARDDAARQLADYVRLHRPTAQGSANSSNLPGAGTTPEVDNGTGGQAVVDEVDLAICTANTARLINAHDWSAALDVKP